MLVHPFTLITFVIQPLELARGRSRFEEGNMQSWFVGKIKSRGLVLKTVEALVC